MEANQFDGCKRGLAVKDKIHFEKDGKPYIGCSSSLYEKSHRPSDLEIVQKALEETGFELEYFPSGNWWIHSTGTIGQVVRTGTGSQSLLTWAKQTIGGE